MKIRTALFALVLLALTQLVFWGMVTVAERQARPADLASRPYVEFQVLDDKDEPLAGGEWFKAEYQGTSGYRADAIEQGTTDRFSVVFYLADKSEPQALFMAIRENLKAVKVNGVTIQPDVPLPELQGPVTSEPAYFLLPMNVLQPGANILSIEKDHEGMVSALPEFSIGPASKLAAAYRWKNRYLVDIPLAGVAILAFTIALCLAVNWPREDRRRMHWLMAFLGSCMLFTVSMTFNPVNLPLSLSGGLIVLFQLGIGLSLAKFVAYDVGASARVHRVIAWITGLAGAVLGLIYAGGMLREEWYGVLFPLAVWRSFSFVIVMAVPAILALCWACAAGRGERLLERMIVAICLTTFVVDRLSSSFDLHSPFDPALPISLYWSPIVGPLLGLGMILSLARQAGEARRTVVDSNRILAARLEEQDAELARSYDAQKQMRERQVMLEERQRIVRDMHDGIGGQLLGLMMQVKRGDTDLGSVEQGLQSSIADLRLIVDSMDTAEEGLAEALRAFEHRVRPQVEAAGFAFSFQLDLSDDEPGPGPRPTLQILRVLQEAVTNAIRHSGGSAIAIRCGYGNEGWIEIAVSDDGRGLPEQVRGGRGLANMRHRLGTIGGALHIEPADPTGTRIRLELPRV